MMTSEERDPGAFLARVKEEKSDGAPGRLKIFFGAVAGVGKTYSMLQTARKLKSDGLDVVIGYVETHGRAETAALLEGFEQIPLKKMEYRGTQQSEFDLDSALVRKPQIILVDELAHTNATGSRHVKRWQDVEELLDSGIDVFTTLNVQHVESLNDLVDHITGVPVQERVPDSIIERAYDIELIDLPPDELIQRVKEGKVYMQDRALHALDNFFRKGNLIALRELALRVTADRVEAQMDQYRLSRQINEPWPASEKILVCVSQSPLSSRVVRAARRMAAGLHVKWMVAYVETPKSASMSPGDRNRVVQTLRLAEQLGAESRELIGNSVSEEIVKCARQNNVSKIVVGKPAQARWKELLFGSVVDDIIRRSGIIDVYVITGEKNVHELAQTFLARQRTKPNSYVRALVVVALFTCVAKLMLPYFEPSNVVMAYMLGVVITATQYGRGPSVMASILSVAAFDFFFVPPYLTFAVSDTQYLITFVVMLIVALVISTLTTRVKQQAESARQREERTFALFSMSRELSSTLDSHDLFEIGLRHISEVFHSQTALCLPDDKGTLTVQARGLGRHALWKVDGGVADWVFRNKKPGGAGTDTLPAADAIYVPLLGYKSVIGVLAVSVLEEGRFISPDRLRLLETFANQIAIACERADLAGENEKARLQMRTEQLKNSLLSSVSHDLRTPLSTIAGAAGSIADDNAKLSAQDKRALAQMICSESQRLNSLVTNLLAVTKVDSGEVQLSKEDYPLDEIIGSAVSAINPPPTEGRLEVRLGNNYAEISVDEPLIQQAFLNLFENAIKHTPDNSKIEVTATIDDTEVIVSVKDNGPGVADREKCKIFEKFHRGPHALSGGSGLGLAIAKGIVQAHGGKIWVEDAPKGGADFKVALPLAKSEISIPQSAKNG
ncbi:MAG: two-component system sensor histidine kinase KdbD [Cyanobacteria bacterium DS2.3.42]|nr:two-component system sensor histidine kinase KdbD [Cyanobacteria bacterium DS2.3.42]